MPSPPEGQLHPDFTVRIGFLDLTQPHTSRCQQGQRSWKQTSGRLPTVEPQPRGVAFRRIGTTFHAIRLGTLVDIPGAPWVRLEEPDVVRLVTRLVDTPYHGKEFMAPDPAYIISSSAWIPF